MPRIALCLSLGFMAGCGTEGGPKRFELLSAGRTGIDFANTITTDDSLNVQGDVYVYNGAGVGIGDIDNDGLPDIYFAGNMTSSRLYLNKGNMRFEDITKSAGVSTDRWATGVSMVDINADGLLDIYVSVSGPQWTPGPRRANLLFVNQGNRTFREEAAQYGIADTSFTTHAAFLDYDRDGCVDLFLLNNSPQDFVRAEVVRHPGVRGDTPQSYNILYHNDCKGHFADVSSRAGILRTAGYGLGVAVADVNRDGWPDIYVSNDGNPNDVLYVNNHGGTFSDKAASWLKHSSFAGMGVDIADYNNDEWPDIAQADMLPRDAVRRKRMTGHLSYQDMLESRSRGLRDDYSVNSLQLSNGVTPTGDVVFSDVAHLAGVAATDWSWSPLFADFDNDGRKDLFMSNGYPKAVNDYDYQTAFSAVRRAGKSAAAKRRWLELLRQLHGYDVPNYLFRNNGDLTFSDVSSAWGLVKPAGYSYGAAYADLDNDGRLDLVVNNIGAPAFVFRNIGPARHWLNVRLSGARTLGGTLTAIAGGVRQQVYYSPFRGFMSTMDNRAHFGLGEAATVDSLDIRWPDGRRQVLTNVAADRLVTIAEDSTAIAADSTSPAVGFAAARAFSPVDGKHAIAFQQKLSQLIDFSVQPLLPYMISRQGPAIAVGDVDGDSLDDVFIAGSGGTAGQLFMQQKNGRFVVASGEPWTAAGETRRDDWGALFFDANGDNRPDLYVASGGYHMAPGSDALEHRLYLNQGSGRFTRDSAALPALRAATTAVRAGDFNGDGRLDLFVGGRLTPSSYPLPAPGYILRNDGGRFTDVTAQIAPELSHGGMITDAVWVDYDGDGRTDLVTVGEWMSVDFYHNDGTRLTRATEATGLPPMRGWWYSIVVGDFDRDGRPDLIAGNLGLNFAYTTSRDRRFGVYANNFTGNQTTDVVLTEEIEGVEYPFAGLVPVGREIYSLGLRYPTYGAFAQAPISQLFTAEQLKQAVHYQADTFASVFLHNDGGGKFSMRPLPNLAQIAPIRGIVATDVDGDGNLDAVVAGNLYDTEPNTTRADAANGLWLKGDGKGGFVPVPPFQSGLLAPLNASSLHLLRTPKGAVLIVGNTGDSLQTFAIGSRK